MVQIPAVSLPSSPITVSSITGPHPHGLCASLQEVRPAATQKSFCCLKLFFLPEIHLGTPPPISFKSLVTIYLLNETLSDLAFNTFHLITLHTNTHMHTHLLAPDSSYPVLLFLFSLVLILFTRLCNLPIYIIHTVYCCLYLPCLESQLK